MVLREVQGDRGPEERKVKVRVNQESHRKEAALERRGCVCGTPGTALSHGHMGPSLGRALSAGPKSVGPRSPGAREPGRGCVQDGKLITDAF